MRDAWHRVLVYFGLGTFTDAPRRPPRLVAFNIVVWTLLTVFWAAAALDSSDLRILRTASALCSGLVAALHATYWYRERRRTRGPT